MSDSKSDIYFREEQKREGSLFPAMDKKLYHYEYPMPSVVVDIVVTAQKGNLLLLVERKKDPWKGCLALPGGFMEIAETTTQAAIRELKEETGISTSAPSFIGLFDEPNRDPRGRIISAVFHVDCGDLTPDVHGMDDVKNAQWISESDYQAILKCGAREGERCLAADHEQIIEHTISWKQSGD